MLQDRLLLEKGHESPEKVEQLRSTSRVPEHLKRKKPLRLPRLSELELVRHYTRLSHKNFSVDSHFYPLGSCTMKYNPKANERVAAHFAELHPLQPEKDVQGILEAFDLVETFLKELCGVSAFTLQPAAGAHGELTGLLIMRAYFRDRGEKRKKVLIPTSAHGTNPATCTLAGFDVVTVNSNSKGLIDLNDLKVKTDSQTAGLMLTNPNTLGFFEEEILKISSFLHEAGALLYYDGANLNALVGKARPGDMGFDIVHVNLHKTFSTPHGGGGPGSGPVGVVEKLAPYLPVPVLGRNERGFFWDYERPKSIGKLQAFYGNSLIILRALMYMVMLGRDGLKDTAEKAVLNANYLMKKCAPLFDFPFQKQCMHEFVASLKRYKKKGLRALDIAKRLLDYGFHAPTVYFPLIVEEAFMVEPTETETKATLDAFAVALREVVEEGTRDPEKLQKAPYTLPVRRLDEVGAARKPRVCFQRERERARSR